MTTPLNPVDSVQVPQTVGLSPEVAFNLVGQAGLAPMFQAQQIPGQPLPGIATQWGQAPATFGGQQPAAGQPASQIIAQNPIAGAWVPRGSVVYMEWVETAPTQKKSSPVGWIVAGVIILLLIIAAAIWFLSNSGDSDTKPSESPTATETVTESASPRPTRTLTETATATATATATETSTATATETATATTSAEPSAP
ncbi:MAG: hypothetical protein R2720_00550 [Candidatus Nanopelagicales bacterium]